MEFAIVPRLSTEDPKPDLRPGLGGFSIGQYRWLDHLGLGYKFMHYA